jgi:poly(glycerol-phosphate) alpha-glucosyltransferase
MKPTGYGYCVRMSEIEMPDGQYLSISGRIHPGSGGQTRALLLRNRLLAQHTNVDPILLSLDTTPDYPRIRQTLREQGHLVGDSQLLNLFEWYRDNDIDASPPSGHTLPVVEEGYTTVDVPHPDGTTYQTNYLTRFGGEVAMIDYRRPDGSVYLRVPAGGSGTVSRLTKVYLVNSKGEPVGRWDSQRGMRKDWILRLLEPDRRAFLICDSRYAIADILPLHDPRLHMMHVVHNIHMHSPFLVNSPITSSYKALLNGIEHLDGLVTLTDRQRQDIADRFGATDNMYVVGHPVDDPTEPDPLPERDPKRFVVLARLEHQKRLEDAIRAFALVVKKEPDARLDIYGDGNLHTFLTDEIEKLGVQKQVTLRGYDQRAADQLWRCAGTLLTSRFEGYSLAILEGRTRGCAVVTYDIKYGPREQITDGVDGFLVPSGDVAGMAEAILKLIRDPALAERMGATARAEARRHNQLQLLEDWKGVLEQVIAKRRHRTTIESVTLDVTRLGYRRNHRLPDQIVRGRLHRLGGLRAASAGFRTAPTVEFTGKLKVTGSSELSTLDEATVRLDAVEPRTGRSVALPLHSVRSGPTFRLTSAFDPAEVFAGFGGDADASATASAGADTLTLRLRLVWRNAAWETTLTRPERSAPNYELSYSGDGRLTLLKGPHAPEL